MSTTMIVGGPEALCLQHVAAFRKHSSYPGCYVGMIGDAAYALHEAEEEDGSRAFVLYFNPEATALIREGRTK